MYRQLPFLPLRKSHHHKQHRRSRYRSSKPEAAPPESASPGSNNRIHFSDKDKDLLLRTDHLKFLYIEESEIHSENLSTQDEGLTWQEQSSATFAGIILSFYRNNPDSRKCQLHLRHQLYLFSLKDLQYFLYYIDSF